jgi:excisionase family DNA binding protein
MAPGNELERMAEEIAGLREEVRQLREALTSPTPPAYLTTREVARIFQVSYETVRRRVAAGKWPAWRDGCQIRFGPEEIAAIEEWGRPKPPAPRLSSLERRQRNKQLRSVFPGGL